MPTRKRTLRGGYVSNSLPVTLNAQVIAPESESGFHPGQNGNPYNSLGGRKRRRSKSCSSRRSRKSRSRRS